MKGFTSPLAAWAETQAWEGARRASRRWRRATQRAFQIQAGFGDLGKDPKTWFLRLGLPPTWRWRRDFQRGSEHVWRRTHTVLRLLKEKVEDTGSEWEELWALERYDSEGCAGSSLFPFLSGGHHKLPLYGHLSPNTVSVWAHSNVCVCVPWNLQCESSTCFPNCKKDH